MSAPEGSIVSQLQHYDTLQLINKAIAIAFIVASALCLIYIFVGAISFVTSAGDDAKVKGAVKTIRYAILGLLVTFISVFIVGTIGKVFLGLDVIRYISYDQIITTIKSITASAGGGGGIQSLD